MNRPAPSPSLSENDPPVRGPGREDTGCHLLLVSSIGVCDAHRVLRPPALAVGVVRDPAVVWRPLRVPVAPRSRRSPPLPRSVGVGREDLALSVDRRIEREPPFVDPASPATVRCLTWRPPSATLKSQTAAARSRGWLRTRGASRRWTTADRGIASPERATSPATLTRQGSRQSRRSSNG